MRNGFRWIVGVTLGAILGIGLSWAYRHVLSAPPRVAGGAERSAVALFDTKLEEFLQAWRGLSDSKGYTAAVLNRKELALRRLFDDLKSTNGSSLYNFNVHRTFGGLMAEYLGRDTAVRVLEIGPGINLGGGLIFSMFGADKYYGLDLYKDPDLFAAPQYDSIVKLLEVAAPQLIKRRPELIMKVAAGQVEFDKHRIEYLYPRQSYDIPLPNDSLHYVFSNATFEHIIDPQKTVDAIARALVKGGVTAHQIDLRDHQNFSKPLEFLKADATTWKGIFADPAKAYEYTNRWRASDFKAAFERAGFKVVKIQATVTVPVDDEIRRSLHPDFQRYSNEDLSIVGLLIVGKKL